MKKARLSIRSTSKTFLIFSLALGTLGAVAFPVRDCRATTELDRKYALETIGFLRAWDNVDGLFADYVAAAYRDYFSRQSRFVLVDLSKADPVLSQSKLPYPKVIEDPQILGQLARSARAQSLIRTKVVKEGPQYRFTLEWLHSPQMDALATEELVLQDRKDGKGFALDDIKGSLQGALDRLIRKVPILGMVTGRDNQSVTVNLGSASGVKPGDVLTVATLDDVKKHPLLKEIVEWRLSPTGKVTIEQVEDAMSFAKVSEESPDRPIARFQKVVQIYARRVADGPQIVQEKPENVDNSMTPPSLGWVSATAFMGGLSRQFSILNPNAGTATGRSGSALALGAMASGQLWLTREWFAELGFGYGFGSYSQKDLANNQATVSGISASATFMRFGVGYSYLVNGDIFGPRAWVKGGYHSNSYSLPLITDNGESLAANSFKSLYLGIGGELPIRAKYGALLNFEFGLLPGGSETGSPNGPVASASDVAFFIGGYYRWTPRMTIRAGIDVISNGAEFSRGASLSEKIVTFSPALLYYF